MENRRISHQTNFTYNAKTHAGIESISLCNLNWRTHFQSDIVGRFLKKKSKCGFEADGATILVCQFNRNPIDDDADEQNTTIVWTLTDLPSTVSIPNSMVSLSAKRSESATLAAHRHCIFTLN